MPTGDFNVAMDPVVDREVEGKRNSITNIIKF
jgi:hypothetical protein